RRECSHVTDLPAGFGIKASTVQHKADLCALLPPARLQFPRGHKSVVCDPAPDLREARRTMPLSPVIRRRQSADVECDLVCDSPGARLLLMFRHQSVIALFVDC